MRVVFDQVTHGYQTPTTVELALHQVSFSIEPGEFLSVIGHTGSGKSTLIQHINGLLLPTAGRVLVDGEDLASRAVRRRARQRIGMVFQYPEKQLFARTVAEDVAFGLRNVGRSGAALDSAVRAALAAVNLDYDTFAAVSPFELSGGQQRRVAIAGVIATSPELLVLDEPTAGLDPMRRDEVISIIDALHEQGTTIVMVTHSMDDAARFSDRVLVLDGGTVFQIGTPAEVFSRAEELRAINLGIPHVMQLACDLSARGFDLPRALYDVDSFADAVAAALYASPAHPCVAEGFVGATPVQCPEAGV
jgi:energy-coupling factor transport system ATP-binding protein